MQQATPQKDLFVALVTAQEKLVYKVCCCYAQDVEDRKDLFQEIILQCWKAFPAYRQDAAFGTWIYRIALNTAISHQRKEQRQLRKLNLVDIEFSLEEHTSAAEQEQYRIMYQLIGGLPSLEKALVLLYLEDRSYQEIADILGLSASNVGTRLGRIREKLRRSAQTFITS